MYMRPSILIMLTTALLGFSGGKLTALEWKKSSEENIGKILIIRINPTLKFVIFHQFDGTCRTSGLHVDNASDANSGTYFCYLNVLLDSVAVILGGKM